MAVACAVQLTGVAVTFSRGAWLGLGAGILVLIVILFFLQDWRATMVPALTIPVSIVGAFSLMYVMGFSINMITLFGMILAIGIVVDDAIVVLEVIYRHIEEGMPPMKAAFKAMDRSLVSTSFSTR